MTIGSRNFPDMTPETPRNVTPPGAKVGLWMPNLVGPSHTRRQERIDAAGDELGRLAARIVADQRRVGDLPAIGPVSIVIVVDAPDVFGDQVYRVRAFDHDVLEGE